MGELNELLAAGRIRHQANELALPAVLWAVVLLGAVVNMLLAAMIRTESPRVMQVLMISLGLMIGLMIFEIVAVDHPLWGEVSIQATPYQQVLKSLKD